MEISTTQVHSTVRLTWQGVLRRPQEGFFNGREYGLRQVIGRHEGGDEVVQCRLVIFQKLDTNNNI